MLPPTSDCSITSWLREIDNTSWVTESLRKSNALNQSSPSVASSASLASDASETRKRKREQSPSKRMIQLQYADFPLESRYMKAWTDLPASMQPLVRQLRRCEAGIGIVPEDFDPTAIQKWTSLSVLDVAFTSALRHQSGVVPGVEFAEHLVEMTEQNARLGRSESMWNCSVHVPLLNEAWNRSVYKEELRWEDITTAGIDPPHLVPTVSSSALASKKVDFGIVLGVQTPETRRHLLRRGIQSLGQSNYEPLRWSPIAISIETKLAGEGLTEANVQSSTWALAQVKKLHELLRLASPTQEDLSVAMASIPALPLLVVQGDQYHLSYIQVRTDSAVLWNSVPLGDTRSVLGVYKVFAALQALMAWAATEYAPWFSQNVLVPLVAQPMPVRQ